MTARRLPHGFPTPNPVSDREPISGPCAAEPEMWFATDPDGIEYAKAGCATCPVRAACLKAALATDEREGLQDGVWAGLTKDERRDLTRRAKRPSRAGRDPNKPTRAQKDAATVARIEEAVAADETVTIIRIARRLGMSESGVRRALTRCRPEVHDLVRANGRKFASWARKAEAS